MVHERVDIPLKAGQVENYRKALGEVFAILRRQHGCVSAKAFQGIENPHHWVLMVTWATLEDHLEGFRKSEDNVKLRALLDPLCAGPRTALHFVEVTAG